METQREQLRKEVGQVQQLRKGNRNPKLKKIIQRIKNKYKIEDKDLECLGTENKLKISMIARRIKQTMKKQAAGKTKSHEKTKPKRDIRLG